ncbi:16S rRNA (guanine(966)-N(2))-methyltransferase RsmD [Dyella sp.]|uniref:16S rRNA (guanine(966)-N(2))-methyltransferase RsmD n=1 Tax=Dyella sp. TaxID=1869338 RepID=UPI002ED63D29
MTSAPGKIRVIGGRWRNSRIEVPEFPGLRPTTERVRETLFNWLMPVIEGARCLDLCAGTGALGIEALSRGAASTQFVEPHARVAQALRDNLTRLKLPGGDVSTADASAFLHTAPRSFDVAFLDPPFALNLWSVLADLLEQGHWLAPAAWIYVEYPTGQLPSLPSTWRLHREGRAGEVGYGLFRRQASRA